MFLSSAVTPSIQTCRDREVEIAGFWDCVTCDDVPIAQIVGSLHSDVDERLADLRDHATLLFPYAQFSHEKINQIL
jgi:hypothetical protein